MQYNNANGKQLNIYENNGFSLVEVLVAIAILAAVFTPIIKSFTTASIVNSKAQITQNATSLAESIMEDVKGKTIQQLHDEVYDENLAAVTNGSTATMTFSPLDDGGSLIKGKLNETPPYKINYSGVTVTQGQTYNASVEISASEYSDATTNTARNNAKKEKGLNPSAEEYYGNVSDANLVKIPKLTEVDSSKNAVLSWEINKYDGTALETLVDRNAQHTIGVDGWHPDINDKRWWAVLRDAQDGSKTLKITLDESGGIITVKGEVIYDTKSHSSNLLNYSVYNSSFEASKMQDLYIFFTFMKDDKEVEKRREAAKPEFGDLYFNYMNNEFIEVADNTSGNDFRVFFVVENISSSSFTLDTIPTALTEGLKVKDKKHIYENSVTFNHVSRDDDGFILKGSSGNNHRFFTNFSYTTNEGGDNVYVPADLFESEAKNKVYYVTVKVEDLKGNELAKLTSTMSAE